MHGKNSRHRKFIKSYQFQNSLHPNYKHTKVQEPFWKTDRQHVEHLKQKKLEKESVS